MSITQQLIYLFVLAIPVASIAWTITHEEVIREFRETCHAKSAECRRLYQRKFFYLFTCEYCFSHYVAFDFPRNNSVSAFISGLARISNRSLLFGLGRERLYEFLCGMIRLDLKKERVEIAKSEATQSASSLNSPL